MFGHNPPHARLQFSLEVGGIGLNIGLTGITHIWLRNRHGHCRVGVLLWRVLRIPLRSWLRNLCLKRVVRIPSTGERINVGLYRRRLRPPLGHMMIKL